MADAIYRKYRPKTFADVTDQSHVVTTVSNQLKSGSVSHAYLFVGPRGVGKTTIARLLAKSVNCEKRKTGQAEPCNECSACVSIGSGSCLDVAEIDAASHTGVDHVREGIIESARFRPSSAKMKVFIIDEVHMLSASAFNALLKTLEEPPEHVLFILATTEAHKIPETIISRCQRFDFRRVPAESIAKCLKDICKLEKIEVDDDVLSEIARRSDGALRDAQSMLSQVFALGSKKITMDEASLVFPANDAKMQFALLNAISANDSALAIRLLNEYSDSGVDIADFTEHLQNIVRDILFIQLGGLEQFRGKYDSASEKELSKIAEKFERNVLTSFLRALPSASKNASNSAIPQLALELLILDVLNGSSNNKNFSADDDGGGPANSSGGSDLSNQNAEKQEKQKKPESNANPRPRLGSAPASPRLDRGRADGVQKSDFSKSDISVDEVKLRWGEFIKRLSQINASMPIVLRSADLLAVEGDEVIVGCAYKLHIDILSDAKNKKIADDLLSQVNRTSLRLCPRMRASEKDEVVEGVISAFGGKVVS